MRDSITFYIEDAREWDEAGMTQADQDALILGLWHWASGKPSIEGMSVVTKALYLNYIRRIEKSDEVAKIRSNAGKKGMKNRWGKDNKNSKANNTDNNSDNNKSYPLTLTRTLTLPLTPTLTLNKESMGDTPTPPACADDKKVTRFVKPTEQEVAEFCREKGYVKVNAADFIDYYESNGWMVGKNKMKDWRRTVSRWERMENERGENSAAGNNGMPVGMILHSKKDAKKSDYEW